jgi:hypothetical protein
VAGGSCRRTRPQTPQAPSEGRVPRHPPEHSLCQAGLRRSRRGPRASTAFAAAAPALGSGASALRRSIAPRWSASALASQRVRWCLFGTARGNPGRYGVTAGTRCCLHANAEAQADEMAAAQLHGKHQRSSRERARSQWSLWEGRETNCTQRRLCPRSGCVRACAQFDCRVRIGCEQWVGQASRVALDAPCVCRHSPRS